MQAIAIIIFSSVALFFVVDVTYMIVTDIKDDLSK